MHRPLTIGYSPCPNDTFIFYALMHGRTALRQLRFAAPRLEDVETLNAWALSSRLDVTKLSFHALGHVRDRYAMLNAGAALGRGCGPLLVSRAEKTEKKDDPSSWTIAVPGRYTTAALLLRLFLPEHRETETVILRFDEIMAAVQAGQVDAGVIIHESRFTYPQYGLVCVRDLGEWWEQETGLPIPLGCIAARRELGPQLISEIEQAVAASVQWAFRHQEECAAYIQQHAQELDDQVIAEHIRLYVNTFSIDLAEEGRAAVKELLHRGKEAGLFGEPAAAETDR
ncbi:MAG: 1,4-dihydroxy-6-naphthoate synthase [Candidatus Electrothrix sp. YB6]